MLRKSIQIRELRISLLPTDKRKCRWIANSVILQCLIVYVGAVTVLECFWSPDKSTIDYDKLVRIMYLYDYQACGYRLRTAAALSDIRLSNETYGFDIHPIKWKQAILTVRARLSTKTRMYIESSVAVHAIWMFIAIVVNFITRKSSISPRFLKIVLTLFFYIFVGVLVFDLFMGFVHIAHIQQSITQGMVLRYSGWSVELKLANYDKSAILIPITASILWMRGIIVLIWNILCCQQIYAIRKKIKKREVKNKLTNDEYFPIPERKLYHLIDKSVLYYRAGEHKPFIRDDNISRGYFI